MNRPLKLFKGYLGWSNMRGGPEVYSVQHNDNGRWHPRRRGGKDAHLWGDLLVDEMEDAGYSEGCDIIVIAIPPFSDEDVDDILQRVANELGE